MAELTEDDFAEMEEVAACADWWTEQLRNPQPLDNADPFTSALGNTLLGKSRQPPSEAQLGIFRKALVKRIAAHLAGLADGWDPDIPFFGSYNRYFGCDYDPCAVLAAAADHAIIPHALFPWKTGSIINPGSVTVKEGYGREWRQIWPRAE